MKTLKSKPARDAIKYKTVMGIDSSSTGVAISVVKDSMPVFSTKIRLDKIKELNDKLIEIAILLPDILEEWQPDSIFIEKPIFVANPATARTLSIVVGSIMTVALPPGYEVYLVEPMSWKSFTKYISISAKFKREAEAALGKTEAKKLCDRLRKSQTQRILRHNFPGLEVDDNDISDSIAIGLYGYDMMATPVVLEVTREIAFDLQELRDLELTI